jgi:hypothetical protein
VVDRRVDRHLIAWSTERQRFRPRAGWQRDIEVGGLERRHATEVQVEGRLLPRQRPTKIDRVLLGALGSLCFDKRAAARPRPVPKTHGDVPSDRPHAWLRDDVNQQAAGEMILGGEAIARDANHTDLRLRRQLSTLEAVNANHRGRSGHFLQLALELVRIVGQGVDLLTREDGAEGRAAPIRRRRLWVLSHGYGVLDLLNGEDDALPAFATPDADILHRPRFETGKLNLDGVAARCKTCNRGNALR